MLMLKVSKSAYNSGFSVFYFSLNKQYQVVPPNSWLKCTDPKSKDIDKDLSNVCPQTWVCEVQANRL